MKIKNRLINASIAKAIGETIPITLEREACRKVVKTRPSKSMKESTPAVTTNPSKANCFFEDFSENLEERKERKAGYNRITQTAVNGVKRPKANAVRKSRKAISTSCCNL